MSLFQLVPSSVLIFPFVLHFFSLLRRSAFSFFSRMFVIVHESAFMMAPLKSLSGNSNISVTLVLASIYWLSFFSEVEVFPIPGTASYFQWKPRPFEYCNTLDICHTSCFNFHHPVTLLKQEKEKVATCHCQRRVKSDFPPGLF